MSWLLCYYRSVHVGLAALTVVLALLRGFGVPAQLAVGSLFLLCLFLIVGGRVMSAAVSEGTEEYCRDCDPFPMLANCDRLLAGVPEDCSSSYVLSLRADRAGVLLSLGRTEEAGEELARLSAALPKGRVTPTAVVCREDQIALALAEGRLQGLEGEIEAVRSMLTRTRMPSMFSGVTFPELMEWGLEHYACDLLLRTAGPVPALKDRIGKLTDSAPCTLYQVCAVSLMAEYCLSLGRTADALPCLRFAADHAPALETGRRAAYRLHRIENQA